MAAVAGTTQPRGPQERNGSFQPGFRRAGRFTRNADAFGRMSRSILGSGARVSVRTKKRAEGSKNGGQSRSPTHPAARSRFVDRFGGTTPNCTRPCSEAAGSRTLGNGRLESPFRPPRCARPRRRPGADLLCPPCELRPVRSMRPSRSPTEDAPCNRRHGRALEMRSRPRARA